MIQTSQRLNRVLLFVSALLAFSVGLELGAVLLKPSKSNESDTIARSSEFRKWLKENVRVVGALIVTNETQLKEKYIIQVVNTPAILTVHGTNVLVSGNTIYRNESPDAAMVISGAYSHIINNSIQ